ncbi:MAG: hypothetical protein J6Y78_15595 [Paludibacteraceae bacterium]|nr:hypothetical protein [Paludibacteraceae bacterium]
MKVQFIAEDGKVFTDEDIAYAQYECQKYEQYHLGIDHGLVQEEDFKLYDSWDA